MRKLFNRTCIAAAVIAVGGLAACQNSQPGPNPGALPVAKLDVTPRLNASTYVAHGHLLEQQGNLTEAAEQYRHALALTPDLLAARNRLGVTLNKLGKHAEASEEFRQALARQPQSAQLHNNLGFSLYLEGRYELAEQELARAVELQPNFRRAQMNHGLALAKLGRYDAALAAFVLAGSEADAHYNLAVVQTEAKQYAAAARSLEKALVLNPDFADARAQLREVSRLAAAEEAERATAAAAEKARADEAAALAAAEQTRAAEAALAAATETAHAEPVAVAEMPVVTELPEAAEPELAPAVATLTERTPQATGDVVLAGNAAAVVPQTTGALAIFEQIQTALESRTAAMSGSALTINADRLTALFAELVTALQTDTPWYNDPQCRTEQLLGVLNEPN